MGHFVPLGHAHSYKILIMSLLVSFHLENICIYKNAIDYVKSVVNIIILKDANLLRGEFSVGEFSFFHTVFIYGLLHKRP